MKLLTLILSLLLFSNCISSYKIRDPKQLEKIEQTGSFKRVLPFHYDKSWIFVEVKIDSKPYNFLHKLNELNITVKRGKQEIQRKLLKTDLVKEVFR
jgi:hypothetical protein